jgi:hypothetical protein
MSAGEQPGDDDRDPDLDDLWEQFASQGLLDEGVAQEGFLSKRGGRVFMEEPDG